jgi:hypothetical protein
LGGTPAGTRYRLIWALALAVVFAVAIAALAPAEPGPAGDDLLPDLITVKPNAIYLTQGKHGTMRLRLDNIIANKGAGPLEIFPGDVADECNPPGSIDEGRLAFQRGYVDNPDDPDSDGFFDRGGDTESRVATAGCMRFHPQHDHWHFEDFAHYELRHESSGKVVGVSTKVGFCLIDLIQPEGVSGVPGSPRDGYYPVDPSNPEGATCSQTSTNGISIGWADIYSAGLQGQDIALTGIGRGRYCLITEADPANRIEESNDQNNSHRTLLAIHPKTGVLKRLGEGC